MRKSWRPFIISQDACLRRRLLSALNQKLLNRLLICRLNMFEEESGLENKKGIGWKLGFFLVVLLVWTVAYHLFLSPPTDFPKDAIFPIKEGSSLTTISRNLEEAKLIRSSSTFQFFAIILRGDRSAIAGDYYFAGPVSVFEIANRIIRGKFFLEPVTVTLTEGLTVAQIADVFLGELRSEEHTSE